MLLLCIYLSIRTADIDFQFIGPNVITMGAIVAAGPSNTAVIDKQGMYWMAGKVCCTSDRLTPPNVWAVVEEQRRRSALAAHRFAHTLKLKLFSGSSGSPYSSFRYMQDIMFVPMLGNKFR